MRLLYIFDLDGTLADSVSANIQAYAEACKLAGLKVDEALLARGIRAGLNWHLFLPEATGHTADHLHTLGIPALKRQAYAASLNQIKPITATVEVLRAVKTAGHATALATNARRENADAVLAHLGITELLDVTFYQHDQDLADPGKHVLFLKAMAHFGIAAEHTAVFEDSAHGVDAARRCGATVFKIGG